MKFIKIANNQFFKLLCVFNHKIFQKDICFISNQKHHILKKKVLCKIVHEIFMISLVIIL